MGNVKGGFSVESQVKDLTTGLTTSTEFFSVATDTSKTSTLGYETKLWGNIQPLWDTVLSQHNLLRPLPVCSTIQPIIIRDRLFTIGIGADDKNRSNAFTILKNGNIGIGELSPSNMSYLIGGDKSNSTTVIESGMVYITGPEIIQQPAKGYTSLVVDGSVEANYILFGRIL